MEEWVSKPLRGTVSQARVHQVHGVAVGSPSSMLSQELSDVVRNMHIMIKREDVLGNKDHLVQGEKE